VQEKPETTPEQKSTIAEQTKRAKLRIHQVKLRGRPPKFKVDMIKDAEQLGALGFTEEQLALYWGVAPRTMTRWKKINGQGGEDLCQAIERGKLRAEASVSRKLFEEATNGDIQAMKYYLNNRAKERWQPDMKIEINQAMGMSIENQDRNDVTFKDKLARQLVDSWTPEAKKQFIMTMQQSAVALGLKLPQVRNQPGPIEPVPITAQVTAVGTDQPAQDQAQGTEPVPAQKTSQVVERLPAWEGKEIAPSEAKPNPTPDQADPVDRISRAQARLDQALEQAKKEAINDQASKEAPVI